MASSWHLLEYANALLVDTASGTMVTGIVTDSNGFFLMDKVSCGIYVEK